MVKHNIQEDRVFLQDSIFKSRSLKKPKAAKTIKLLTGAMALIV
jgi:hypothetical protein